MEDTIWEPIIDEEMTLGWRIWKPTPIGKIFVAYKWRTPENIAATLASRRN